MAQRIKYLFCLIVFLFCLFSLHAQKEQIDSLLSLLNSSKDDTNRVNVLNRLCYLYVFTEPEKVKEYGMEALALSEKIRFKNGIALSLYSMGMYNDARGDYALAIDYYLKSLKINEEEKNKIGISKCYNSIGGVYGKQGNYLKSLEYLLQAKKILEEMGNKKDLAASLNNIGIVYDLQGDQHKAIEMYQKSLDLYKEFKDDKGLAAALENIGNAYVGLMDYNKAMEHFEESMSLRKKTGDKRGYAITLGNIGGVLIEQKNYLKSIDYFQECLAICSEIGFKDLIKHASQSISLAYSNLGKYKNAYEYHKLYSETKDSLLNEESSKQIAEMQTKYETEKKEQQITLLNKDKELQDAQLNRQKIIIWSVAAGLLVVLVLSIFIFRERRKSEKLLLNILPAETARELKAKGRAEAKHYESVTVMFTDFKGFTNIAEKLSAEELVSELDFLFKKFDEIISKYNIEKIKTIGDAYMCASGLPTPNQNHAEQIVKAGIEIQNWMTELKTNDSRLNTWELRMGIHSGPVTAGVVGDKKFAYDIWGDTVNIASRMESSGEAGKINISGSTYELIKNQLMTNDSGLTTVFRGKIPAKNKGEIDMYFIEKC